MHRPTSGVWPTRKGSGWRRPAGFALKWRPARIEEARPTLAAAASGGLGRGRVVAYQPILDEALRLSAHRPRHILMLQRDAARADLGPGYLDWDDVVPGAAPTGPVPLASPDPLYILYTSGTTGKPKGFFRNNGGHSLALAHSMGAIYEVHSGDVMWITSE